MAEAGFELEARIYGKVLTAFSVTKGRTLRYYAYRWSDWPCAELLGAYDLKNLCRDETQGVGSESSSTLSRAWVSALFKDKFWSGPTQRQLATQLLCDEVKEHCHSLEKPLQSKVIPQSILDMFANTTGASYAGSKHAEYGISERRIRGTEVSDPSGHGNGKRGGGKTKKGKSGKKKYKRPNRKHKQVDVVDLSLRGLGAGHWAD